MYKYLSHVGALLCGVALLPLVAMAQTVSLIDNMQFGMTDVAASPPGGTVMMGPDGTIAYGTNLSGPGTGVAGKVQLAGSTGQGIEIRCSATATLARAGGDTISLSPIKASFGTALTYAGAADCAGVGVTVATGSLSATATDNIAYFGGQLDIGATAVHGAYSSTLTNGVPLTVTVIFN